jgi:hypothetical protein
MMQIYRSVLLAALPLLMMSGCSDMSDIMDPDLNPKNGIPGSWEIYDPLRTYQQINSYMADQTCYNTTNGVYYLNGTWSSTSYSLTYHTLNTWAGTGWVTAVPSRDEMHYYCLAGSDNQYMIVNDLYHRTAGDSGIVGRWQFEMGFWTNGNLDYGQNKEFVFTSGNTYTNYDDGVKISSGVYIMLASPNVKLSNTALHTVQTYTYLPMNGSMAVITAGADRPLLSPPYMIRQ